MMELSCKKRKDMPQRSMCSKVEALSLSGLATTMLTTLLVVETMLPFTNPPTRGFGGLQGGYCLVQMAVVSLRKLQGLMGCQLAAVSRQKAEYWSGLLVTLMLCLQLSRKPS